jgi:hypothetical protein
MTTQKFYRVLCTTSKNKVFRWPPDPDAMLGAIEARVARAVDELD